MARYQRYLWFNFIPLLSFKRVHNCSSHNHQVIVLITTSDDLIKFSQRPIIYITFNEDDPFLYTILIEVKTQNQSRTVLFHIHLLYF